MDEVKEIMKKYDLNIIYENTETYAYATGIGDILFNIIFIQENIYKKTNFI